MFNLFTPQPEDKILALVQAYRADPREDKIDLGVGVYRNAKGATPIMRAVKTAERRWWEQEETKAYTGLTTGEAAFAQAMIRLVLGDTIATDHVAAAATPGGTGAVRQAFEMIRLANPQVRVFVSDPTWPNHLTILKYLGIETVPYRYFDADSRGVDFAGMREDLTALRAGDVVLLHGCCHNPTGANLTAPEWQDLIALMNQKGAVPVIDIAYQGFGDGLEEDATGVRLVAAGCPEALIAASCSKNFGIYRERTGILMAVTHDPGLRAICHETLAYLNRQSYTFPPDHGARLVSIVLNDDALRADWQAELEDIRLNMLQLREQLAGELQRLCGSDRFGFIAQHRGMFSRLGLRPETVRHLREARGIYMIGDSRINIAGLNADTVPILAQAIVDTGD